MGYPCPLFQTEDLSLRLTFGGLFKKPWVFDWILALLSTHRLQAIGEDNSNSGRHAESLCTRFWMKLEQLSTFD